MLAVGVARKSQTAVHTAGKHLRHPLEGANVRHSLVQSASNCSQCLVLLCMNIERSCAQSYSCFQRQMLLGLEDCRSDPESDLMSTNRPIEAGSEQNRLRLIVETN